MSDVKMGTDLLFDREIRGHDIYSFGDLEGPTKHEKAVRLVHDAIDEYGFDIRQPIRVVVPEHYGVRELWSSLRGQDYGARVMGVCLSKDMSRNAHLIIVSGYALERLSWEEAIGGMAHELCHVEAYEAGEPHGDRDGEFRERLEDRGASTSLESLIDEPLDQFFADHPETTDI